MSKNFLDVFSKFISSSMKNRLKDWQIEKVVVSSNKRHMDIYILAFEIFDENKLENIEGDLEKSLTQYEKIKVLLKYNVPIEIVRAQFNTVIYPLKKDRPMEYFILNESKINFVDNNISISTDKNSIYVLKKQKTDKKIKDIFYTKYNILINLEYIETENNRNDINENFVIRQKIKYEEEQNNITDRDVEFKEVTKVPETKRRRVRRRNETKVVEEIIGESISLSNQLEQDSSIIVTGTILNLEKKEIKNGNFIIMMDIYDGTDSVTVKFFIDPETFKDEFVDLLKKGNTIKIKGYIRYDLYAKELNIMANDICPYKVLTINKEDNEEIKRVELHLHTNMSKMDGVNNIKDYIKTAEKYGHKSLAITDHGVVQSFPDAMYDSKKAGIKILYGVEAYLVDDTNSTVFLCNDQSIDTEYIVFDLETTGFSSRTKTIIEIGAVKIRNGEIVDEFNELINPEVSIPAEITKLTKITNQMVDGKDTISIILPKFIDFIGSSVLVAHNASFDIGFLNAFKKKILGQELNNTYIDTVNLSRSLYPDLKNHKLNTITDFLKISLNNHHRAVDDARATAEMFLIELRNLKEQGLSNLNEINDFAKTHINKKNLRPNHGIIFAKNSEGLRNLYKLVSDAHLNNYQRNPRILLSLLDKHRTGLILGSACEAGQVFKAILNNMPKRYINEVASYYDYLEVQPIGNNMFLYRDETVNSIEELCTINMEIIDLGDELDKKVVATGDVHFLTEQDKVYRSIIMNAEGFKDIENQPPLFYRTTKEMLLEFDYLPKEKAYEIVVENTNFIADEIEDLLPIPKETFPPIIEGSDEELTKITMDKAIEIYGSPLPEIVEERLNRELKSIITNGFSVMYIIAQKLVWNSLEAGYLVGSRGSVGSSLVATMAQITEVNPLHAHYVCPKCKYSDFDSEEMKQYSGWSGYDMPDRDCPKCGTRLNKDGHDIPFETFLGFDGDKEPDIDLNFSSEYQAKAHEYTEVLFGKGYVFKAGTIGTVAQKTAYGYVNKYLEERNITKRKAEITRLSSGCVGIKRTTGQHPGGLMVVPDYTDVYNFTPLQRPANDTKSDIITTHFDYHSISGRLLKLDILGHTAPTIIKMLHESTGIDPLTVDLGDEDIMSLCKSTELLGLKKGDISCPTGTLGLPELGTSFVRKMLIDSNPSTFTDLVRISGLSHGTDVWNGNAQDLITEGMATLKEVIATRDDIMVYLIHAGVEKKTSFTLMEKIRKGKGITDDDIAIMKEANIPKWYINSCKKIKYLFPKGHAVAYVIMAVRIGYFKIHYPKDFYAASFSINSEEFDYEIMCLGIDNLRKEMNRIDVLKSSGDPSLTKKDESSYTLLEILEEMYVRNVSFLPLDLYNSHASKFRVKEDGILPPLCAITGLGINAALNIVEEREKASFNTIEEFRIRTKANKNVIDIMRNNNIFGDIPETNQLSFL